MDLEAISSGTGPQTIRLFRNGNTSASDTKFQILNPGTTSETFRVDADTGRVTSAGGGIEATTGNIVAAAGTVIGQSGITATTGDITAAQNFVVGGPVQPGGGPLSGGGISNPGHEIYSAEQAIPNLDPINSDSGSHFNLLGANHDLLDPIHVGQQIWIYGTGGNIINTQLGGLSAVIPGAPNSITLTNPSSSVCLYSSISSGAGAGTGTWRIVGDSGAVVYA